MLSFCNQLLAQESDALLPVLMLLKIFVKSISRDNMNMFFPFTQIINISTLPTLFLTLYLWLMVINITTAMDSGRVNTANHRFHMSKIQIAKIRIRPEQTKGGRLRRMERKKTQLEVNVFVRRSILPSQNHTPMMSFFPSWKNYQIKKGFSKNGILNIYLLEVMTIKLAGFDEIMF